MKWFLAMLIGALSGWLIVSLTDEVAIATAAGAAIGVLATIGFFGTRPLRTLAKVAIAMAVGCVFGWIVALLTTGLAPAMVIGAVIGVLATLAVATERPALSLLKLIGAAAASFALGWAIGAATGNHHLGLALAVPIAMLMLLPMADTVALPRRPF